MAYGYGYGNTTPSGYLEEAAALLRKVAEDNERENRSKSWELHPTRERIAHQFAGLAAIEMGVIPAALARDLLDRITAYGTQENSS